AFCGVAWRRPGYRSGQAPARGPWPGEATAGVYARCPRPVSDDNAGDLSRMRRQQRAAVFTAATTSEPTGAAWAGFLCRVDRRETLHAAGGDRHRPEGQVVHRRRRRRASPGPQRPSQEALDDAMIAFYQNGERLMPANGYPMRLLLPGYEGNMNVKYLRRIKLVEEPAMSFWEARTYAPILPNGKAYQFYLLQEVKSFITQPSPGLTLKGPGFHEISGIAYSGTGRIAKVMVSADGGRSWAEAALAEPVLSKAVTRFRMPWRS